MRVVAVVCLLFGLVWAQQSKPIGSEHQNTFTSPDGAFQFNYSDALIVCQKQDQGDGVYTWAPAQNCMAYHPVCDGDTQGNYTGITCLAYPRNQFTDTQAFEAATFSVEILDIVTSKSCLAKPASDDSVKRDSVMIHGVWFVNFEFSEAGMSQSTSGNLYRTFHRGKCYQLGVNAAAANAQAFDPPVREMTQHDWDEVNRPLREARDSFRFLK